MGSINVENISVFFILSLNKEKQSEFKICQLPYFYAGLVLDLILGDWPKKDNRSIKNCHRCDVKKAALRN